MYVYFIDASDKYESMSSKLCRNLDVLKKTACEIQKETRNKASLSFTIFMFLCIIVVLYA